MSNISKDKEKKFYKLKLYFKNNFVNERENLTFYGDPSVAKDYFEREFKKQKVDCKTFYNRKQKQKQNKLEVCDSDTDGGLDFLLRAATAAFRSDEIEDVKSGVVVDVGEELKTTEELRSTGKTTSSECETYSETKSEITEKEEHDNIKPEIIDSNEIIPIPNISSTNIHFYQNCNESRLEYLFRIPFLVQLATNTCNLEMLKYIVDEAVTEDCIIKTAYLDVVQGRSKWYDQVVNILNTTPDYYIANTSPMFFGRCIVVNQFSYGTFGILTGINNNPETHYLFNPFTAIPIERMDDTIKELKYKYDKWTSEGKLIRFVRRVIIFYILNEELTHIEQRVSHCDSLELFEVDLDGFVHSKITKQ